MRTKVGLLAVVAALALGGLACRWPESTETLELPLVNPPRSGLFAYAFWDCSRWSDAPHALTIYVTESVFEAMPPNEPYLEISVYPDASYIAHRTIQWPGDEHEGSAAYCEGPRRCERVPTGRVAFGEAQPNSFVEGDILFRSLPRRGPGLAGHFRAAWGPRYNGCG
jgi:hypothetical protein